MVRSNEADRNSNDNTNEVYENSNENEYETYGDQNAYEAYRNPNGKNTRYNKNFNSNQAPIEKPTMMKVMRNAIKRHWKTIGGFQISCESLFFTLLTCQMICS